MGQLADRHAFALGLVLASATALLAQASQSPQASGDDTADGPSTESLGATWLTAHFGNGIAYQKRGRGTALGLGGTYGLGPRCSVVAEVEYARADFNEDEYVDARVGSAVGFEPYTRSFAVSAGGHWHVPLVRRHRFSLGAGLVLRHARLLTLTEVSRRFPLDRGEPFLTARAGVHAYTLAGLRPELRYDLDLGRRLRLGAYLRYEQYFRVDNPRYLRILSIRADGTESGRINGQLEFLDAQRATAYGLTLAWQLGHYTLQR